MQKAKPKPKISRRVVERQEALFARLQPFARTIEASAARRPGGAVPDAVRARAEALLYETQPFRERPRRGLPPAAPLYIALSAQLAEALGTLLAFEARHSQWDAVRLEPRWAAVEGAMPIRRLQPKAGSKAAAIAHARAEEEKAKRAARMVEIRRLLVKRLDEAERS